MSSPPPPGPPVPPIPSGPHDPSGPSGAPAAPPRRPRGKLPWILGGICALFALLLAAAVAIGAIWFFALRSTPQDAVEQYLEAWDAQDCESYEAITTERFRGGPGYSCEQWTSDLQEQSDYQFDSELGETEIDGDSATVAVTEIATHPDGDRYRSVYAVDLVDQDGAWLLDGITPLEEPQEI